VTIFAGETPIVLDPGVFAYHEDPAARDRFRSTPYHSTVNFAGKSHSEMLRLFLFGRRRIVAKKDNSWECRWIDCQLHRRSISVNENEIIICDIVVGKITETVFVLH